MPALDFPASPLAGDKYPVTPVAGQPQYTYDGVKWTTVGAQVTTAAPAAAVPLMDQTVGLVGTATKYAREDHVHPKVPAAGLDAYAYSGMQINGSMEVSQQYGIPASINAVGYICDGWQLSAGSTLPGVQGVADAADPKAGFSNRLFTTANAKPTLAAADFLVLSQSIEGYRIARLGWGTANAQPLTIGFWTQNSVAGVYSVAVKNGAATRSYATTYTQNIGSAVEYKTITIPGCTDGVWDTTNGLGMGVVFALASGTTYAAPSANSWLAGNYVSAPGQVNGIASAGGYLILRGVVVLPGIEAPSAARSPLIMRPFDQELVTCKRYWEKITVSIFGYGAVSNSIGTNVNFTEKRALPTAGAVTYGANSNANSPAIWDITAKSLSVTINATAAGQAYIHDMTFPLDARL